VLKDQIIKLKKHCTNPYAVNIPLLYPNIDEHIKTIIEQEVPIVFSSAGNPKKWTGLLKENGIKVVHVVSSSRFALKAQDAGVDAVVAEGFEAGGHNGREETTTLVLIPQVVAAVEIPVIAAGGIATGKAMFAAMALGAEGVQIGSRFVCSNESSAHQLFKQKIVETKEGETSLTLKELAPVRLVRNAFYTQIEEAYRNCASADKLREILGRGRAKKGMFEGDLEQGELEIGQVSGMIENVLPAKEILQNIIFEFNQIKQEVTGLPDL